MAKRDPSAAAYLVKIEQVHQSKQKMSVNLISPGTVRVAVKTMKKMIVEKIVTAVAKQRKACLIFDSTQDFSKKEANVLLIRYLEINDAGAIQPVERLVEVFTTGETSGCVLKEEVIKVLNDIQFDMAWIVGQCYDGAGNMRGKYAGKATLIQNDCKKAVYIWCNAPRNGGGRGLQLGGPQDIG